MLTTAIILTLLSLGAIGLGVFRTFFALIFKRCGVDPKIDSDVSAGLFFGGVATLLTTWLMYAVS